MDNLTWESFIEAEELNNEGVLFRPIFVDMVGGDVTAGLLLSQIVYWYKPGKNTDTKLRVKKYDGLWLAKTRYDWWNETRISPRVYDRAIKVLKENGLVKTRNHFFRGIRQIHIQIVAAKFLELYKQFSENPPQNPYSEPKSPNGDMEITKPLFGNHQTVTSLQRPQTQNTNKECLTDIPLRGIPMGKLINNGEAQEDGPDLTYAPNRLTSHTITNLSPKIKPQKFPSPTGKYYPWLYKDLIEYAHKAGGLKNEWDENFTYEEYMEEYWGESVQDSYNNMGKQCVMIKQIFDEGYTPDQIKWLIDTKMLIEKEFGWDFGDVRDVIFSNYDNADHLKALIEDLKGGVNNV